MTDWFSTGRGLANNGLAIKAGNEKSNLKFLQKKWFTFSGTVVSLVEVYL